MSFFLLPLLVVILTAILSKSILQFVFKLAGRENKMPVFEERLGAVLFLICADLMAAVAYWYPMHVIDRNAAPDDRFGGIILFGFPFYFIAAGISGFALFRLVKAVLSKQRNSSGVILLFCGGLLATVAFSPIVMFALRILLRKP